MESQRRDVQWTAYLEDYLKEVGEKCICYHILHKWAQDLFNTRTTYIDLPVIVLSTIAGTLSIGSSSLFTNEAFASTAIGVVSLFVSVLNTVGSYFAWARRTENHRVASIQYAKLYRFIAVELSLPVGERMSGKDMLRVVQDQYDRMSEIAPLIPARTIDKFKHKFRNVSDVYKPEETNGLHGIDVHPGTYTSDILQPRRGKGQQQQEEDIAISGMVLDASAEGGADGSEPRVAPVRSTAEGAPLQAPVLSTVASAASDASSKGEAALRTLIPRAEIDAAARWIHRGGDAGAASAAAAAREEAAGRARGTLGAHTYTSANANVFPSTFQAASAPTGADPAPAVGPLLRSMGSPATKSIAPYLRSSAHRSIAARSPPRQTKPSAARVAQMWRAMQSQELQPPRQVQGQSLSVQRPSTDGAQWKPGAHAHAAATELPRHADANVHTSVQSIEQEQQMRQRLGEPTCPVRRSDEEADAQHQVAETLLSRSPPRDAPSLPLGAQQPPDMPLGSVVLDVRGAKVPPDEDEEERGQPSAFVAEGTAAGESFAQDDDGDAEKEHT